MQNVNGGTAGKRDKRFFPLSREWFCTDRQVSRGLGYDWDEV